MKREYNEVYGFMPTEIINHLSSEDRMRLFLEWMKREPTQGGWIITTATINALGEDFLTYIFKCIISVKGEDSTKEEVIDAITAVLQAFATDINILNEFVNNYLEEVNPFDIDKLFNTVQDSVKDDLNKDKKCPPRDAKGRFAKKQKM